MPAAKPRAGKPKMYCSDACKAAAYRLRKGQDAEYYLVGNVPDTPLCARESCQNPAEKGRRGYKMYCSPACKQKVVRERLFNATRSQFGPAIEDVSQTLPTEPVDPAQESPPPEPPKPKRRRRKAKRPADDLLYWRKGRGVVHMGVQRNVTFCGRDVHQMAELDMGQMDDGVKMCQRCQNTRDNQTWWHGWRDAFGDEVYED